MDRIDDDFESVTAVKCPHCGKTVERRDHSAQMFYTRRLNRILTITVMLLVAAMLSFSAIGVSMYNTYKERGTSHYLLCRALWELGKRDDPFCIEYAETFAALNAEMPLKMPPLEAIPDKPSTILDRELKKEMPK